MFHVTGGLAVGRHPLGSQVTLIKYASLEIYNPHSERGQRFFSIRGTDLIGVTVEYTGDSPMGGRDYSLRDILTMAPTAD
jgi:hypothetical protein